MIGSFWCFFGFLVQKYFKNHPKYSDSPLLLKNFFSIFYRNTKISTSCTAKSIRLEEKWSSNLDSASKKTYKLIMLINCVFQNLFSVTLSPRRYMYHADEVCSRTRGKIWLRGKNIFTDIKVYLILVIMW